MTRFEDMTDEELIRRIREGDDKIIDFLMNKYKNLVRKEANAMYILGGETDDLIQEGMIGLFKAVQKYDLEADTSFFSFAKLCIRRQIYTAVEAANRKKHSPLNSYISYYEKASGGEGEIVDTIEADKLSNPEELLMDWEGTKNLEEQLEEALSDLERRVLYLHLQGIDYKKIAALLDKSDKTIDNALQRIKTKTQKIISQNQ